jgi:hypothetical protein
MVVKMSLALICNAKYTSTNHLSRECSNCGIFACSNIPEDVSLVLERTIQEGSKQNPPAGQEEGLMRDPFESGSVSFDFVCMSY